MRRFLLAALAALVIAPAAGAHGFTVRTLSDAHVGTSKTELVAQRDHSQDVLDFFAHHHWMVAARHSACRSVPWSKTCTRARRQVRAHHWLLGLAKERYSKLYEPTCGAPTFAACSWYARGDTQCEVSHEGAFTSVSPDGTYAGRFQMDAQFERGSSLGRAMQARYGRANNWPAGAQIEHAYEVWTARGWSPWPPYYKYGCAAYIGRSYP